MDFDTAYATLGYPPWVEVWLNQPDPQVWLNQPDPQVWLNQPDPQVWLNQPPFRLHLQTETGREFVLATAAIEQMQAKA
jgi:hypothetical protein